MEIDNKKIVIFGAGKIGRSFIGQLFGRGGYKVVFIDVDQEVIDLLNQKSNYRVVIKEEKEYEILVPNVSAINATNNDAVAEAIATAGLLAVSVGKNALFKIIPLIATGLKKRFIRYPEAPLDIIIAENMRSAAKFVREQLIKNIPFDFPVDSYVGLIETSIGKMVPITPENELNKDPLVVFAEGYNTLILDKLGFRSRIPEVDGLAPKDNINAWVDRKAFIHNLGHATAAYYGHHLFPGAIYMYEILDKPKVLRFTRDVMFQAANILINVYPKEFIFDDLTEHIDDLLNRFKNKALKDTIFRVGQDLPRKLSADDRFVGVIHLASELNLPYNLILKAMSYAFVFNAKDEQNNASEKDSIFLDELAGNFEQTCINRLFYHPEKDKQLMKLLKTNFYGFYKNSKNKINIF